MTEAVRRYMFRLSYIGTQYRGLQKHVRGHVIDVDTIQGAVESSVIKMSPLLVRPVKFVFAGRTDAGVHALTTTAHADVELTEGQSLDTDELIRRMNRYLINSGHQIRVHTIHQVAKTFHARHSAKRRSYVYRFLLAKQSDFHQVPIVEMDRTLHLKSDNFDIERLKRGLRLFQGIKDFQSFSSPSNERPCDEWYYKSYVKSLEVELEKAGPLMPADPLSNKFTYWNLYFSSKSFLYKQIRRISGALFALGTGRIDEERIMNMLQVPNHANYSYCVPAPPHGLYLRSVEYDDEDTKEIFT